MNSSSDESFAWENASSGSDDGDIEYPKINGEGDQMKVKHERSIYNGEEDDSIKEPKSKKRKHIDEEDGLDQVESPKKKKVKTEPDQSDSDVKKKKKKVKTEPDQSDTDIKKKKKKETSKPSINGYLNTSNECDQLDDDKYLEMCVKQEQEYLKCSDQVKPKKSKKQNCITSDDIQVNLPLSDEDIPKKEKKTKKKKKSKEPKIHENKDQSDNSDESIKNIDHSINSEGSINIPCIESHSHQPSENGLQKSISDETLISLKKNALKPIVQSTPNIIGIETKKNPGRLLDRIQFEEDPDSDIEKIQDSNDLSAYLIKYQRQNEHLQVVSKMFQNGSEISNKDEIWILKCPHDVDVQKLLHTEMNLDNKSKIKINCETYCGNLDETERNINIMTLNKNFFIKNTVAKGTIHFRKRLPKPHVQDHNIMVNNQTDFIPLPETKCRHPLFGSNYKDAINVRVGRECTDSAVAEVAVSASHEKKKKKKHKRDHRILPKVEMDTDISFEKSPKREIESDVSVKKAKKRKHTNDSECVKKKTKKIKLEPDSVEAWESEKAIEENLFNF